MVTSIHTEPSRKIVVMDGYLFVDNQCYGLIPGRKGHLSIHRKGDKVYCNGYEHTYCGWRRTLKAILYDLI